MKTRLVAILICLTIFNLAYSQKGFKNNGAKVIVNSGGIINITGGTSADFINASSGSNHGRIDLDGKIKLEGDWSNNATSGGVFINVDTDGDVQFLGTSAHSVAGSQTDFEKLTLNTSGNVTLSASATANGNLTLTNGLLVLGTNNLTLGVTSAISGTPSATNMVVASSTGELRKTFTGAGSFTYPIGDNTSTVEYSPITLNFASGTFGASAYAGAKVTNAKHPSNTSTTGYINRYWSLSQNNISGFSCGLTATYKDADIFGTETSLFSGYYSTPYWVKLAAVNSAANQLTGTVTALNPITAGDQAMFCTSTITINEVITNVACYGNSTGAVNVTVTGGYGAYSYNWSGSGVSTTSEDQSGLAAGTYYLTVTDQNGCMQTDVFIITQPSAALALTTSQTNVNCYGNNTGAIDLTVTGGTPSYTYNWSNSATSQDLSNIIAGDYSVTVTDGNGCQANTSATITQPISALSVALTSQTNVSCFGGSNGVIDITVSGGTPSYSYNWGGSITTEDRSGLIAGTYTVTVTDSKLCTATKIVTITQPSAALAVVVTSQTNVNCYGNSTGAINITASGGTTPYNYNWGGGITSEDRSDLSAGNYSVTVTDVNGCTANVATNITQPSAALAVVVTSQNNVSCFGGSNGAINITATGGTTPYNYSWGTVTTEDRTNIAAGTYSVTVTDNKSCTATTSAIITQPTDITVSMSKVDATCYGSNNGSATATPSGGTGAFSYSWNDASFQTTATANNLIAGTYNVTVIDANSCTKSNSVTVSQPTEVILTTSSTQQSSCSTPDGTATANITGGVSPYDYVWSNGDNTMNTSSLNNTISSLASGSYGVTVTDANNCSISNSANVSSASSPSLVVSSQVNVSCNGGNNGSVEVLATGGTSPYNYTWAPVGFAGGTTATYSNLISGVYTCTVTDINGCSASVSATVTQPAVLNASITASTNVSCFGGNNGSATVTVSGGTPNYTYNWTGGLSTSTINNLTASTYNLTVTDNKGCTKLTSVEITQPTLLSAGINSLEYVSCYGGNDGSVGIVVSGGTLPYSYIWSNGSTNEDLSSLVAGSYYFTVTDANGCTVSNSLGTIVILEPASALTLSASSFDVNCFNGSDGSININVSGGTPNYSYLWSNNATSEDLTGIIAGNYIVTVTDANNCVASLSVLINQPTESLNASIVKTDVKCYGNSTGAIDLTVTGGTTSYSYLWSDNSTSEDLSNITAGNYNVTVTDANGCKAYANTTIAQPVAALLLTNVQTNVLCFAGTTGSIDVSISGGTTPYSYAWSNSTSNQDLYSLSAGNYGLTVTDFNNCQITSSYTITEPTQLVLSMSGTDVSCYGGTNGSVSTSVSGGVTSYTYLWNSSETSQNLVNTFAGIHTVTVTDANNCKVSDNFTVNQPDELFTSATVSNISCYNAADGSISLTTTGGTTPYSYNWSNTSSSQNISSLNVGNYDYTVTDNNGCKNFGTESITQPDEIILDVLSFNASCGNSNGEAIVSVVSGGIAPFTYLWSNNDNTASISSLSNGTYNVTVTDNSGCTATASAVIGITYPPTVSISTFSNASCFGTCNGNATVQISGGQAPYNIMWNDPSNQTTSTAIGLCSGNYSVSVTDNNMCSSTASVTISQPTAINVSISTTDATCFESCNGTATLNVSGGTSGYTYQWADPLLQQTQTANNLCTGNVSYTVTDANNCNSTGNVFIGAPVALSASITATNVTCNGGNNGAATLTVVGGTFPYSFLWSNTASSQNLSNLTANTYSVTVTDSYSCITTASVTISEPVLIVPVITGNLNYCAGSNTSLDAGLYSSYLWSNSEATQVISATAGTYSVTVTDANGCTGVSADVIVVENSLPSPVISGTLSYCEGSNTTLDAGVYSSYLWSTNETSQSITATSGNYIVTVTDSNGCVGVSSSVDVVENLLPTPSISGNLSYCAGFNTTLDAGAYTSYLWSTSETTQTIIVTSGNYEVTVSDVNGCSGTTSVVVIENSLPVPTITGSLTYCAGFSSSLSTGIYSQYLWSESSTSQSISATIANNPISVTVTDANGCVGISNAVNVIESSNYSPVIAGNLSYCTGLNTTLDAGVYPNYIWSTNETTQSITVTAGTYDVTVSDNNGCSGTASVQVVENALPVPSITGILAYCAGSSTQLDAGTFSSYNWSNGESSEAISATAGTYVVTVTDNNGCEGVSASVDVVENALPTPVISGNLSYCEGSNTTLDAGVFPNYIWSTNETTQTINVLAGSYSVSVTDVNGCIGVSNVIVTENLLPTPVISGNLSYCTGSNTTLDAGIYSSYIWSTNETTQTITALAGSYSVSVTDNNGCMGTVSVVVVENSIPTPVITGNLSYCVGSNTTLSAGQFDSYLWSTGEITSSINVLAGTYDVTVFDNIGCQGTSSSVVVVENSNPTATIAGTDASCFNSSNGSADLTVNGSSPFNYLWSNGGVTEDINSLVADIYSVQVTDVNGCSVTSSITINEPDAIAIDYTTTPEDLGNDGAIDVTVSGGTVPYTFAWSNFASSEDLTGLTAGFYYLTVTDANNCTQTQTFLITNTSCTLSSSISSTNISCFGLTDGNADLTVSGGTTPYSFSWSNFVNAEDINGLGVGYYFVTITDNGGCNLLDSVYISSPSEIVVSSIETNVSCNGGMNGAIDLIVSGGTTPYSFIWSNGIMTEDLTGLSAGVYTGTLTDANGCSVSGSSTISEPAAIIISSVIVHENLGNDGSIDLTVSGGTTPYTFTWDNGAVTEDINGLAAGTFIVTINDANGCSSSDQFVINNVICTLIGSIIGTDVSCFGLSDGSADLTVTGGTTPYTFNWSNSEITEDISGLTSGSYFVTIIDNNGCTSMNSVTISEPTALSSFVTLFNVACNGENNGSIDLTVSGGTTPYTFAWDNGATTEDLSGLVAGVYSETITDAHGCTNTGSIPITEPSAIVINSVVFPATSNDGAIDITVSGGTTPYAFAWDNSATTEDISGLSFGYYTLTLTDGNGCIANETFYVNDVICTLTASIIGTDVTCFGLSDGSADLTVTGGTSPYTFIWSNSEITEDISGLVSDTYEVTVTDAASCVDIVSVMINEPSALGLVLSSTDDENAIGNGTATAIVSGGTSPYTYLWNDALAQTTSVATNLSFALYSVTVTDNNGCAISDTIRVRLYVGIISASEFVNASIYPNPAKEDLNILISTSNALDVEFVIYDAIGQIVYNNKVSTVNGNNLFNIDLSNKADGIYFIKFNNSLNNQLIRFVKSGN